MRLSVNEDGNVQIDLDPDDEQITINIGPAEVVCFGSTIADPGTGPLVQVVLTDPGGTGGGRVPPCAGGDCLPGGAVFTPESK